MEWIEEYSCGCSSSASSKKKLLGYCAKHGSSKKRSYKIMPKVLRYNPWNFDAEPGDIMVSHDGRAWKLYDRPGSAKSCAGELSQRELKKPGCLADIVDGKLVWKPKDQIK